jgi:hypothetical protein
MFFHCRLNWKNVNGNCFASTQIRLAFRRHLIIFFSSKSLISLSYNINHYASTASQNLWHAYTQTPTCTHALTCKQTCIFLCMNFECAKGRCICVCVCMCVCVCVCVCAGEGLGLLLVVLSVVFCLSVRIPLTNLFLPSFFFPLPELTCVCSVSAYACEGGQNNQLCQSSRSWRERTNRREGWPQRPSYVQGGLRDQQKPFELEQGKINFFFFFFEKLLGLLVR